MGLALIQAPAEALVTLDEARLHLRVDLLEETDLIGALIEAATAQAEAICRRRFVTQRWRHTLGEFPAGAITLPHPPVVSVESVQYVDADGVLKTVAIADYDVRTNVVPGEAVPAYGKSWPSARAVPDAVRVDFTCGFGGAAAVPDAIKRAVLLIVGTLHANRETVAPVAMQPIPHAADWLLSPYRVHRFAG